jgi:DNA-binding CsgD family transcriptional regulator/PAS domain-containing protein
LDGLKPEVLSSVIEDIYDCALAPEGWAAALTRIALLMNSAYATISLSDPAFQQPRMAAFSPWDPVQLKILNEDFGIDGVPGLKEVAMGDVDHPRSTLNEMSEPEFQATRFYRDWVAPQGLRDACVMKFVHSADRIGVMAAITRADRDIVTADERRFMRLISPHIRRAAMIGDLLDYQRVETRSYRSALDGLQLAVVLVDGDARILYENAPASAMLRVGVPIKQSGGHLIAANPAIGTGLADAIRRAAPVAGDHDLGARGIAVPVSTPKGPPAVAYVLPLASKGFRAAFNPATAAVFITTTIAGLPPAHDTLATLYDLTPSEARVLVQIGSGLSTAEVALALGLSANTVKTYLSRLFAKTGVQRQSDLVRIVTQLTQPIAPV